MLDHGLVVTDLDGTLLNSERHISAENRRALAILHQRGVIRVAATGRSLYSVRRVLQEDDPFDYVVFSSGAGIMDWQSQDLVHASSLSPAQVAHAVSVLVDEGVNFMVHDPVPENHRFAFHQGCSAGDTDFLRRMQIYESYARSMDGAHEFQDGASQLLAVIPPDLERLAALRSRLPEFTVIRATSPIDHHSMWVEVFPPEVSKAQTTALLTERLGLPQQRTRALGNDYNDEDLLAWAAHSLVTDNAPDELKCRYGAVTSNDGHALAEAVALWDAQLA